MTGEPETQRGTTPSTPAAPATSTASATEPPAPACAVVTLGETMGSLRAEGPLRLGSELRLSVAGAESNVAVGLARLGHTARWIGRVGDDEPGRLVLRTLRAERVDTTYAPTDPAAPTGLMLVEPRLADLLRVQYHRSGSAGSRLSPADVPTRALTGARVLHVTGVTCALGEGPREAVRTAVATARDRGLLVSLDVNYRARLWDRRTAAATLRPLAALADLVIASDDELDLVGAADGGSPERHCHALLEGGATREVVVKLGSRGATLHTAAGTLHGAPRTVAVRDLVGAGDAFTAGYLSGWLEDLTPEERLYRANTLGAFAVASRGDWEGLPDRSELALLDHPEGATVR